MEKCLVVCTGEFFQENINNLLENLAVLRNLYTPEFSEITALFDFPEELSGEYAITRLEQLLIFYYSEIQKIVGSFLVNVDVLFYSKETLARLISKEKKMCIYQGDSKKHDILQKIQKLEHFDSQNCKLYQTNIINDPKTLQILQILEGDKYSSTLKPFFVEDTSGLNFEILNKSKEQQRTLFSFKNVAVAGTFDHLHSGHKILLNLGAFFCEKSLESIFTVAVLTNTNSKKFYELIQDIELRIKNLQNFISKINPFITVNVEKIFRCESTKFCSLVNLDKFSEPQNFLVIVCNEKESKLGLKKINFERNEKNLKNLNVFWKEETRFISSTKIRKQLFQNNNN